MCFGGGGSSAPVQQTPPAEAAAIASQKKYREERQNRTQAYDGFATDIIGLDTAKNDNAPSAALKKLMGA
jgi:hypothetical protein